MGYLHVLLARTEAIICKGCTRYSKINHVFGNAWPVRADPAVLGPPRWAVNEIYRAIFSVAVQKSFASSYALITLMNTAVDLAGLVHRMMVLYIYDDVKLACDRRLRTTGRLHRDCRLCMRLRCDRLSKFGDTYNNLNGSVA